MIHKYYERFVRFLAVFLLGATVGINDLPPIPQFREIGAQMALVVSPLDKLLATDPVDRADADPVELIDSSRVQPGLIAVLLGESPRKPAIRIIDRR